MASPDLAGFRDAQARLRDALGVDVIFTIPAPVTWPAGTPLDPESGKPYDPFIEPEGDATPGAETARCSFVHRPVDALDPRATPVGRVDRGSAALILNDADYQRVRDATLAEIGDEVWKIENWRQDVSLSLVRWFAYLEHA